MREGHCSRNRVLRILTELERNDYLVWSLKRRQRHLPDGTFEWADPVVYEAANAPKSQNATVVKTPVNQPELRKPTTVKPYSGKRDTYKGIRDKEIKLKRNEEEVSIAPPFSGPQFLASLADFEKHRTEIHKPLKPTGRRALYKKLSRMDELEATERLDESVANGWSGVFKEKKYGTNQQQRESASERNVRNTEESLQYLRSLSPDGGETFIEDEICLLAS